MTVLCCLQLSPPENEILELFSEDLRVPGTFSWPLWLFSTFVGRKSLKWRSTTLYNQKWSCNIGVPVDPHFLFVPQEYKLFLHFNLITISVIYSLTIKLLKYSNKHLWWDGKPKDSSYLQCLTAVPSRGHHLHPSPHTGEPGGGWGHSPWAAAPLRPSSAQHRSPARPPAKPRAMCWKKEAHRHVCRWRMFLWLSQSTRI